MTKSQEPQSKIPYVFQFRLYKGSYTWKKENASPHGGLTIVYDPETGHAAVARCSEKDHFQKKVGISIAMGRLQHFLHAAEIKPTWLGSTFVRRHVGRLCGIKVRSPKPSFSRSISFKQIEHYLTNVIQINSLKWNGIVRPTNIKDNHPKTLAEAREYVSAIVLFAQRYYQMSKLQKMLKDVREKSSKDVELPVYKKPVPTSIGLDPSIGISTDPPVTEKDITPELK